MGGRVGASVVVLASTLFAFIAWRLHGPAPVPRQGAVVFDTTAGAGCPSLGGVMMDALALPDWAAGSKFELLVFGTADTGWQPISTTSFAVPVPGSIMIGPGEVEQRRAALVGQTLKVCGTCSMRSRSGAYQAVATAVRQAKSSACPVGEICGLVYVVSDGLESVNGPLHRALLGLKPEKGDVLPEPIDNAGTRIVWCGASQLRREVTLTDGKVVDVALPQDADWLGRMERTWASLFTHPALVSFRPVCPRLDAAAVAALEGGRS